MGDPFHPRCARFHLCRRSYRQFRTRSYRALRQQPSAQLGLARACSTRARLRPAIRRGQTFASEPSGVRIALPAGTFPPVGGAGGHRAGRESRSRGRRFDDPVASRLTRAGPRPLREHSIPLRRDTRTATACQSGICERLCAARTRAPCENRPRDAAPPSHPPRSRCRKRPISSAQMPPHFPEVSRS